MATQTENAVDSQAIAEYCRKNGYNLVHPKVRVNKNGYPYVTFMDKGDTKNVENIYLTKKTAKNFSEGDDVVLKGMVIFFTKNDAGDDRVKLGYEGEGSYVSLDSLL